MGIVNLEDMINPRPTVEEKLEAYYATATPEQVVKEFEALGVEFKPITVEKKVISTSFKISNELADMWNNSPKVESVNSLSDPHLVAVADDFFNEIDQHIMEMKLPADLNAEEEMWNPINDSIQSEFDDELEIGIKELLQDATSLPTYLLSDPEIVGYPNLEFQEQIYDWVKGSLPTQGYTIKDLGCGRGDFFGHISKREEWEEKFKNIHYFGIELNPNLCDVGKQKYPEINILNNDYFEVDIKTDYTVCIGTLGDNLGQNKWENFNKTLNWAISNTKTAVIFILQRDCYQNPAYFDYPFTELFENIDPNVKFVLDYSEMEDIYKLTVHIDGFNY